MVPRQEKASIRAIVVLRSYKIHFLGSHLKTNFGTPHPDFMSFFLYLSMATSALKIYRQVHGYEQKEIADVLGISPNTYSRLERNPENITGDQVKKLAEFYNVDIKDLLSEASPVITFQGNAISQNTNAAGFVQHNENHNSNNEIKALKEEIEYLRKQNSELIRALGERK